MTALLSLPEYPMTHLHVGSCFSKRLERGGQNTGLVFHFLAPQDSFLYRYGPEFLLDPTACLRAAFDPSFKCSSLPYGSALQADVRLSLPAAHRGFQRLGTPAKWT
jgi:hypothetical protein